MLEGKRYSLNELRTVLGESTKNEFKPRKGDGVDAENKKNNGEAVRDIEKRTKEYDGGFKGLKRRVPPEYANDYNKTTLDYDFNEVEPSDEYKERVKAQVKGYPSAANEKNTDARDNGGLEFEGNEKFYDDRKDIHKRQNDKWTDIKHSGLAARELDRSNFEDESLFKESRTMKRLHFRNTTFLSEAQMLKKVPENYKFDGNKFVMRDATGTDYLIECKVDDDLNYTQLEVVGTYNKQQIKENLDRIKKLYGYNSGEYFTGTNSKSRLDEQKAVPEMLNKTKGLIKE